MPYPQFNDNGEILYLDLHGSTVADGLFLVRRALEAGARAGRARVDVVHGFSSSTSRYDRTIKNALMDAWEEGEFDAWVADVRWDDVGGRCSMWLKLGRAPSRQRLTLADLS